MYIARALLAGLGALALCQCQSGPEIVRVVTLEPGDAVRVVYRDAARGLSLTLQNDAIEAAETLYSSGTSDPFVKVSKDAEMQDLLDALATHGFFRFARAVAPGGERPALLVEINDQVLTWERQAAAAASAEHQREDFINASAFFLTTYNATESFHAGVGMTREDMERQQQLLQQRALQQGGRIKTDRQ